ncbi:capsid assembly scaffolding protein Gp46 family protein [Nonomuraea aridisoli]|uniref:DUF4355 domain-containing protein n=1 Tax=Nonomuraea aridisoli TaxID=2070368 RepID=A0A2W2E8J7_9ACTN|nr:DUF4355 domain-containing protein [Nonomuraea aridisoli]PZG20606.1 hypothetical protein C1J01_08875 [Nonomuraea aridisoli]
MTTHDLPVHPRTGLRAIGLLKGGRPIWPVLGGSEGAPEGGGGDGGAGNNGGQGNQPPATFTQADVDRIVSERLGRERTKYADYDDLKSKAAKYDELSQSQKTEAQRQQEQLEEALGRATRTEVDLWKERAARKHGLDDELMAFLTGETEQEVLDRAKTLADKLKQSADDEQSDERRPGGRRTPAPDHSQGRGGGSDGGSLAAGRERYRQRTTKT